MATAVTLRSAATGGALIGLSAALLWVANGRIAGISGIPGGLGPAARSAIDWRPAVLAGLVVTPIRYALAVRAPAIAIGTRPAIVTGAGLPLDIGTRVGGGRTSAHGACGLASPSWRPVVAAGLSMVSAAATVFLTRHVFGV